MSWWEWILAGFGAVAVFDVATMVCICRAASLVDRRVPVRLTDETRLAEAA